MKEVSVSSSKEKVYNFCFVYMCLQRVKGPDHIGTVLVCGAMNWDLCGRKAVPKGCKTANVGRNVLSPHRFGPLAGVRVRVVASGCNAAHSVVITEEWKAMTFGKHVIHPLVL